MTRRMFLAALVTTFIAVKCAAAGEWHSHQCPKCFHIWSHYSGSHLCPSCGKAHQYIQYQGPVQRQPKLTEYQPKFKATVPQIKG